MPINLVNLLNVCSPFIQHKLVNYRQKIHGDGPIDKSSVQFCFSTQLQSISFFHQTYIYIYFLLVLKSKTKQIQYA